MLQRVNSSLRTKKRTELATGFDKTVLQRFNKEAKNLQESEWRFPKGKTLANNVSGLKL